MAQLDYSIGTARTPLNIQPGIQNYFQGQSNKRQNQQAKMLAEQDQKRKTIADFVSQSMTEDGELDRKALSSRLLNKGWIEDETAIQSDLLKQDRTIAEMQQKKDERDQQTMAGLADFYLNSEDRQGAYQAILSQMEQERIPMPQNWGPEAGPEIDQMMDMISTRFGQKSKSGSNAETYGVNPLQFINPETTETRSFQLGNRGGVKPVNFDLPDGFLPAGRLMKEDDGGQIRYRNPITGSAIGGSVPKTIPPEQEPDLKRRQAEATAKGTEAITRAAELAMAKWDEHIEEKLRKEEGRKTQEDRAAGTVVQDVGRALYEIEESPFLTSGPGGWATKRLFYSPARRVADHIESIRSNIGINQLQEMRNNSPTGGALGQVPFQQQQRLEQLLGSIDVGQDRGILQDNLKRVFNLYNDIIHGEGNGPKRHELSFDEVGRPLKKGESQSGPKVGDTKTNNIGMKVRWNGSTWESAE